MEQREGEVHCGRCKQYRPEREFPPSQRRNGGWCRACHHEYYRQDTPALPPIGCEVCGARIEEPTPGRRFCSASCKQKARYRREHPREARICGTCGADITHKRRGSNYCSTKCAQRARVADGRITPELRRKRRLLADYGITVEQYEYLLTKQDSGCAVCGHDGSTSRGGVLHVDHCHNKGHVRGLLCDLCNRAIGLFRDDPALLRRAADYLEAPASD